ncbi:MAG: T9SS type A sorting domain-containing protein [Chitinophagaceae bacterium]|nr:T9SS type A sorting domain-containing protein [Chitinophagaceae bacterium]
MNYDYQKSRGLRCIVTGALLACCSIQEANAQLPGSESSYGGGVAVKSIGSGGTSADVSETLYIGPGTHIIDGTWEIYARQVVVDPTAQINGTGTIILLNPSAAGGAASTTLFDGNDISGNIDVNVSLQNVSGLSLTNIAFPADLLAGGWTNNATASTIYLGKDLDLAVDGADVFLGTAGLTGDLRLDADATISNYRPERMVVTNNSIQSHLVKEGFSGAFTFPVGIADGDYTPSQITNGSANTVRVSVQDYTASASPEQTLDPGPNGVPSDGMNRTWHIYGDNAAVSATVNLQHNTATNQSGFDNSNHYVTQWGAAVPNASGDFTVGFGGSPWQTNTGGAGSTGTLLTPAGTLAGSTMRSRSYSGLATGAAAEESYFSKSSDPFHPLPIQLLSFRARSLDCDAQIEWQSGDEESLKEYKVMHSKDGIAYQELSVIAPRGDNSVYRYVHRDAGEGAHYYHLLMVNTDGIGSHSPTETTRLSCVPSLGAAINVYPNPAREQVVIDGMDPALTYRLGMMADNGRVVLLQLVQQSSRAVLDLRNLPAAPYLLQVQAEGQKSPHYIKVVKL